MSFSLIYLAQRALYMIFEFLRHWYVGGFLAVVHQTLNVLERLDRVLALKVTLRYLFRPLYQDYTLLGYFLGFVFRTVRVLVASLVYFVIIVAGFGVYGIWAAIPPYLIAKTLIFNS